MVKFLARRWLHIFSARYQYDTAYMEALLDDSLSVFLRYGAINVLASHRRGIPAAPWWAARIRAALHEDCGPCVQLVCNMAASAGISPQVIADVVAADLAGLDDELALAVLFTEQVLARNPAANTSREQVRQYWGQKGLVSLATAISITRFYPSMKYVLGYGRACSRIQIEQHSIVPGALASATLARSTLTGAA
jgi:alkylhydroperoxidase family enzyme